MPITHNDKKWYAVRTLYKCEKLVSKLLTQDGIENYVPLQTVLRVYGRQKRKKLIPLISTYIFVHIDQSEYIPVLQTEKVLHFIKFKDEITAIPEKEINILKRIVGDSDVDVDVYEGWIPTAGERVYIKDGALYGLEGTLEYSQNKKFIVHLEHIGVSLKMTVDLNQIGPIKSSKIEV